MYYNSLGLDNLDHQRIAKIWTGNIKIQEERDDTLKLQLLSLMVIRNNHYFLLIYLFIYLYLNISTKFIQKSHKLETTEISIKWWMYKHIFVYPHKGSCSTEKKQATDTYTIWMEHKSIIPSEWKQTQFFLMICDSVYV